MVSVALVSCGCLKCLCVNSTRAATARCAQCTAGDHRGLPRKASPGVPIPQHERMYSQTCSVCGAIPGMRCFRYQDRINAKAPEIPKGDITLEEDLRGKATPSRSAQAKQGGKDAPSNRSK